MYYSPAGLSASVGTELTTSKLWQIGNNNSGFDSPLYQELGKAANTETDPAKLKQVFDQVNDLMLDESFVIPLTPRPPTNVTRAAVQHEQSTTWWLVVPRCVARCLSRNRVCFDLFTCPPRRSDPTARDVRGL